ncbi:hypothetical protein C2E23DRAFT_610346 [Lenzites betulinus]|nr:hypothetical protein C2E23DRAFT_610346 [Lenzites betulinus]
MVRACVCACVRCSRMWVFGLQMRCTLRNWHDHSRARTRYVRCGTVRFHNGGDTYLTVTGATSTTPRASPASGLPGRPPLWQADFISLATPLRTKRRHRCLISGMPAIRQCRYYSAGFRANYLPHACYAS